MKKELMSYPKFKHIMETILEFMKKRDKVSDFFEKEIMEDSWCLITFGSHIEQTLVNLLADEFECWYTFKEDVKDFNWWEEKDHYGMENDIETWLYSLDEKKTITINGKEIDITSIPSFYDFLVEQYNDQHKDLTN